MNRVMCMTFVLCIYVNVLSPINCINVLCSRTFLSVWRNLIYSVLIIKSTISFEIYLNKLHISSTYIALIVQSRDSFYLKTANICSNSLLVFCRVSDLFSDKKNWTSIIENLNTYCNGWLHPLVCRSWSNTSHSNYSISLCRIEQTEWIKPWKWTKKCLTNAFNTGKSFADLIEII